MVLLGRRIRNPAARGDPFLREYTPLSSLFSLVLKKKDQEDHGDPPRTTGPETQNIIKTGLAGPSPQLPSAARDTLRGLFPSSRINHTPSERDRSRS